MSRPSLERIKVLAALKKRARGEKLESIALDLKVPVSTISRNIQKFLETERGKAKRKAIYFEPLPVFMEKNISREERRKLKEYIEQLDKSDEVEDFAKRNGVKPPTIWVPPTTNNGPASWAKRLTQLGKEAGPELHRLIRQARYCGVSWGETLLFAIENLPHIPLGTSATTKQRKAIFVPVVGEVLEKKPTKASATSLAGRLDEVLHGDYRHTHALSLQAVPAIKPPSESSEEARGVAKLVNSVDGFRRIFGPAEPPGRSGGLINKIDMLLTSVGPPDRPLGWLGDDLLRAVGLKRAQVAQLVEGDISGVLLPRQGRDIKLDGHLEKIRGAWTGITMDDLKRCHERAQRNGMPGVVVIALGKNKATAVAEVIRLGICDHLFIDRELSENLKKALRA